MDNVVNDSYIADGTIKLRVVYSFSKVSITMKGGCVLIVATTVETRK